MKNLLFISILAAASVAAQTRLPFQEQLINGRNQVVLKAPDSITTNFDLTIPSRLPTATGKCITSTLTGVLSLDASCEKLVSDYNWSQTVGARSGSGAITLTFTGTSCPAAGTDAQYVYRLYESLVPTTYELAISNGTGTCVRGGAGTIVATGPTGTYTTAVATSASGGFQEAIFSVPDSTSVRVRAGLGNYDVYSNILTEDRYVNIDCDGPGATLIPKADNIRVIYATGPVGPRIHRCAFNNVHGHTGTSAVYTYNSDGSVFGTSITDTQVSAFSTCFHLATVYAITAFTNNRLYDCSNTALYLDNPDAGDAGIGEIGPNNQFSDNVAAPYGIYWNGPGNLKVKDNSFNGYVTQIHLEEKMGTVNVSGTAVTWVSGNKFRPTMAGTFFANDGVNSVASIISSVTDDQNIVLTTSGDSCTGCNYYVNISGQIVISGNTLDTGTSTINAIRATGNIPLFNFQIQNNFISNPGTIADQVAILIDGSGWHTGDLKGNSIQSSVVGTTTAISVTAGNNIHIYDTTVWNRETGVNLGVAAINSTVDGTRCVNSFTTNCILSAETDAIIREINPVTFAQLTALAAANSSRLYCSNCMPSGTCASGGTGANATRVNGAWKCEAGGAADAYVQGGNSFGADANIGTNDTYPFIFKTNNLQRWFLTAADGHLHASTNNAKDIGAGLGANSPRNIYAATSVVATTMGIGAPPTIGQLHVQGGASSTIYSDYLTGSTRAWWVTGNGFTALGTTTADPLVFTTDATNRWRIDPAGMFTPEVSLTYDIGTSAGRVRGIYGQFGDFATSAGTSSSDYLSARKFNLCTSAGGAGCWDFHASGSMAATSKIMIRDNAGSRWLEGWRALSGSPLNYTSVFSALIPAKRLIADGDAVDDSVFPDFGTTGSRWPNMYGVALDLTGAANITGNLSAAVINATGSPAYRVAGTTVITAARAATFTDLTINTASAPTIGYVWTATSTGGAGSWQAFAASQWTNISSDIYFANRVMIGSTSAPKLSLEVVGTQGAPATSGTTPTGTARFVTVNSAMDIGSRSNGNTWLQVYDATNLATNYDLELNPNGGNVQSGHLLPIGTVSLGASGDDWNRLWVGGVETSSFSRPQVDLGATNGTASKQWSATYTGTLFASGTSAMGNSATSSRLTVSDTTTIPTPYTGTVVHAVGTTSQATRFFADSFAALSGFGGRRANGSPGSPSALTNGQAMFQIGSYGYGATAYSTTAKAGMTVFAGENWTDTAQGTSLVLFTTPLLSTTEAAALTLGPTGLATFAAGMTVTGTSTFGEIRFTAGSTFSFGQTGTRALRVFTDGITTGGTTFFENGSTLTLRPTNSFVIDACATPGEVLTAGASGVMACAAVGAASAPFIDSTAIMKGSADATKLLKIEVDGFTTATTRTLTPQNADYTIAGTNIAQTFSGANTFSVGQTMSDITPATSNTHVNGSSSSYWNQVRSETFYVENSGRIRPTTTNTGSVGISTARFNKGWFTDLDITGTITAPSGNTGYSGTISVRKGDDSAACNLVVSGGLITSTTC